MKKVERRALHTFIQYEGHGRTCLHVRKRLRGESQVRVWTQVSMCWIGVSGNDRWRRKCSRDSFAWKAFAYARELANSVASVHTE